MLGSANRTWLGRFAPSGGVQPVAQTAVLAIFPIAVRGIASSSHKALDRALRRPLVRHAARGALLRRLSGARLWSR
jgi:hypothetical protein